MCCQMSHDAALMRPFSPKLIGRWHRWKVYFLSGEDRLDSLVELREVVVGAWIVRHRAHMRRNLKRIRRPRFERGKERKRRCAVEGSPQGTPGSSRPA